MKKYKLIKKYPGSPILGTIAEKAGDIKYTYPDGSTENHSSSSECLFKTRIENHPEFWEEVVEYPIGTKVYNSQTNTIYTKKEDGWYRPAEKTAYTDEMIGSYKHLTVSDEIINPNPLGLEVGKEYTLQYIHCDSLPKKTLISHFTVNGHPWGKQLGGIVSPGSFKIVEEVVEKDYEILEFILPGNNILHIQNARNTLEFMLNNPNTYKIYNIKRKSDDEIFTIGDKTTLGIITCFRLLDNEIMVDFDNKNSILLKSKQLQHIKQPLFTTEDGVDIFEGEKYYCINANLQEKIQEMFATKSTIKSCFYRYFSTKEKAEEYILMNKPCLSLKDFEKLWLNSCFSDEILKKVRKLVQQKLIE